MSRLLLPICLANFQSRASRTQVPDTRRSNPLRFRHPENGWKAFIHCWNYRLALSAIKSRGSDLRQVHYVPHRHWSVGGVRESPHGSYTRHNFLIDKGLKFRNFIFSPNFNQVASQRYWISVYLKKNFSFDRAQPERCSYRHFHDIAFYSVERATNASRWLSPTKSMASVPYTLVVMSRANQMSETRSGQCVYKYIRTYIF